MACSSFLVKFTRTRTSHFIFKPYGPTGPILGLLRLLKLAQRELRDSFEQALKYILFKNLLQIMRYDFDQSRFPNEENRISLGLLIDRQKPRGDFHPGLLIYQPSMEMQDQPLTRRGGAEHLKKTIKVRSRGRVENPIFEV